MAGLVYNYPAMVLVNVLLACVLQLNQSTTVEGRLLDRASGLPVAGARVILVRADAGYRASDFDAEPVDSDRDTGAERSAVLTGDDGGFRFLMQDHTKFHLLIDAPGYVRPWSGIGPENEFEASTDEPKRDIVVRLTRELAISGRVRDDDTGQPVSELVISPFQYRAGRGGRRIWPAGASVRTDAEGRFKVERLRPGEYYLEVSPASGEVIRNPKAVGTFAKLVNKRYVVVWYPGVADIKDALPVRLPEGINLDGVNMRIAKRPSASIRGRVLGGKHLSKNEIALSLGRSIHQVTGSSYQFVAAAQVELGSTFQIDGLSPGVYWLSATAMGQSAADLESATMTLQVGEENQDGIDLYLQRGVTVLGLVRIEGREVRPEESMFPGENMDVQLNPLIRPLFANDRPTHIDNRNGAFTLESVTPDEYVVDISPVPSGYKVSEVLYNGSRCRHGIIPIEAGTKAHKVEITLARASASILVTATDGNDHAPGAAVLLTPEPIDDTALRVALRDLTANQEGRATVSGLLPGTYRLTAYKAGVPWGEDRDLMHRLANGTEVTVNAKQTAVVQVPTHSLR